MEELKKELIEHNTTILLSLEYLGVHFDEVKEEANLYKPFSKTAYYYSVPESSILEVEDQNLNEKIKTANGLKHLAKEMLIDMMLDNCRKEFGEDADEFISDVKNTISDYCKFYAKVRSGEIWNKELAEQRIKDLAREIQEDNGYKEI